MVTSSIKLTSSAGGICTSSYQFNKLNNDSETVGGTTTAATLAARERLDLGVGVLNNREHALVFSAGDLFLGGALDASR